MTVSQQNHKAVLNNMFEEAFAFKTPSDHPNMSFKHWIKHPEFFNLECDLQHNNLVHQLLRLLQESG